MPLKPQQEFTSRKRLLERKAVTIIAGFKFEEGVVLCADTQETIGEIIKNQVPKLRIEKQTQAGSNMAVAFCGATDSGPFIEKLTGLAWEEARTAKDLDNACLRIEKTIKNVYAEFGDIFQNGRMPDATLIFGITMDGRSRLFEAEGPIVNEKTDYAVAGIGQYLARFLVNRLYTPFLTANQCVILAAYVLSLTKEYVEGCGGDSHVALLRDKKSSGRVHAKLVEEVTELCKFADFEGGRLMRSMADMECTDEEFKNEGTRTAKLLRSVRKYRIPAFEKRFNEALLLDAEISGQPLGDLDIFGLPKGG
jgi:20S proteasome alpha/beta subunit